MTRINLVPPEELSDQHLFAEFREIKMVPKSLRRSLVAAFNRGETLWFFWHTVPKEYTLNKGHVSFFYNKGEYLRRRYALLRIELDVRGINYNKDSQLDPDGIFAKLDHNFNMDYEPTPEALAIVRARIAEKIALKPSWYRYRGERIYQP